MLFKGSRKISYTCRRLSLSLVAAACLLLSLWGCAFPRTIHAENGVPVHFACTIAGANRVSVAGSFNGWSAQANPMHRRGDTWSLDITLRPGRHVYAFVVDDHEWRPDPGAVLSEDTGFGTINSVLIVE